MTKAEQAVNIAIRIANDDTHGYDQSNRWGPDYDCSSFLISVWHEVGVDVKAYGATWTGNMKSAFIKAGFAEAPMDSLRPGDILLNESYHTEMYIGNGLVVGAASNENGGATGGATGDQTGREIRITNYYTYSHGWDCVLRYVEPSEEAESGVYYIVKTGDTWWGIAEKCLGSGDRYPELMSYNGIPVDGSNSIIYPGQKIRVFSAEKTTPELTLEALEARIAALERVVLNG